MFQLLDLVAPIGIAAVSVFLCAWALTKAETSGARAACILCGIVFTSSIPAWYIVRYRARKADYVSTHRLRVRQGKLNRCERPVVEAWTEELIDLWASHCQGAAKAIRDKLLVCVDQEKLSAAGRWVRGYSVGYAAVVGWDGKLEYTKSLFRHEMSHIIASEACGLPWNEKVHHEKFKEVGL